MWCEEVLGLKKKKFKLGIDVLGSGVVRFGVRSIYVFMYHICVCFCVIW